MFPNIQWLYRRQCESRLPLIERRGPLSEYWTQPCRPSRGAEGCSFWADQQESWWLCACVKRLNYLGVTLQSLHFCLSAALLECHWATGALIRLLDESPGCRRLRDSSELESVELAGTTGVDSFADLPVCWGSLGFSHPLSRRLCPYICLIEQNGLLCPPFKVERGRFPGLSDELLHQAHLLLQHHSGQPVPRRPPLQSHVPEDYGDWGPATVLQLEQTTAQRWETDCSFLQMADSHLSVTCFSHWQYRCDIFKHL